MFVEPFGAGAVVVELEPVSVGVVEGHGDVRAVVGAVVDRVAVVEQPLDRVAELAAVGVQERDVVEAGVPVWGWGAAGAVPGVQPEVVVVVARGEERGFDSGRATVGREVEAEDVAVEMGRAVQIGDAQVHVPDADRGMDWFGLHADSLRGRL